MRKFILFPVFILLLAWATFLLPASARGAGSVAPVYLSIVGSSSAKNDGSVVTLRTSSFWYECPTVPYWRTTDTCDDGSAASKSYIQNARIYITVSGSGNTLGGTQTDSQGAYIESGADGSATFTVASTVAESKTVTATDDNSSSVNIYFIKPAATVPTQQTTTTTTTPTPKPAESTPPEAPKTSGLEVDGKPVTATDQALTVPEDQPLVFKGKTVPNGVVKLYIFSTPREATVTADAQGNWSYAVAGLEPGSHHVEAEVTDPATNKTSARATLASFTIQKAAAKPSTKLAVAAPKQKSFPMWIVVAVAVGLAAAGVGGWWVWRHKNTKTPMNDDAGDSGQSTTSGMFK